MSLFAFTQVSQSAGNDDLFTIVKTGTLADVKAALKNGADVNAMDKYGYTVLMWAAEYNTNPDVIEALIDAGANVNVNAKNFSGRTALDYAAAYNTNPDVTKALIAAGANVNARNGLGMTALLEATRNRANPNLADVIKALIDGGADVNARDEVFGWTVLMNAACYITNPNVIEDLIAAGANVNARNGLGMTALMRAASWNTNPDVIKALIDGGANVNARDSDGKRAIDHLESNEVIGKTDDSYWTIRDLLY